MAGQTNQQVEGDELADLPAHHECRGGLGELADAIQSEILPRLIIAHASAGPGSKEAWQPSEGEIEEFADMTLKHDHAMARSYIHALRETGVGIEDVLLGLLGPAARHLGDLWEQDRRSFTDVTIGLGTMHALLRDICPDSYEPNPGRRALLIPLPGEQHALGIRVIAEIARMRGWEVDDQIPDDDSQVMQWVKEGWFETVGISVSAQSNLDGLNALVADIRENSRNSSIKVLVGGQIFSNDPELANSYGADATASDALEAVDAMNQFTSPAST